AGEEQHSLRHGRAEFPLVDGADVARLVQHRPLHGRCTDGAVASKAGQLSQVDWRAGLRGRRVAPAMALDAPAAAAASVDAALAIAGRTDFASPALRIPGCCPVDGLADEFGEGLSDSVVRPVSDSRFVAQESAARRRARRRARDAGLDAAWIDHRARAG